MSSIDAAAQAAEAKGLSVMLKPQLVTDDPAFAQYTSGSWINLVDPNLVISNPDAFFAAYKAYIMKWAVLAQKDNVTVLSIGNEMVAATKPQYTAYWDDIIASIRSVYSGQLTYSALLPVTTNSTSNEVTQIGFWNKLDFAGFDVYPSLATTADPTVSALNAGWTSQTVYGNPQNYKQFVADMAATVGKPVIFTETGLPSFAGASDRQATSDGNIGSNNDTNTVAVSDYTEQANWWESFFETWAVDKPSWLAGVFVWNNDPEDLGASAANSYNLIGKPAASVVTGWYGGRLAIAPGANVLTGSQASDNLYAFGVDPATAGATSLKASLDTTVSVAVTASLLNGLAPAIDIVVNGKDYGTFQIQPNDSGYVNSAGVHFVTTQTFSVTLPGLQSIQSLQIVNEGPVAAGGSNFTTFFQGVAINGMPLTKLSYTSAGGYTQQQLLPDTTQGGSSSQWDQGVSTVDASAWNQGLATMTAGSTTDPIMVSGNGGTDTLHVLGSASQYDFSAVSAQSFQLRESAGLGQNIDATGVAEVIFADSDTLSIGIVANDPAGVATLTLAANDTSFAIWSDGSRHAISGAGGATVSPVTVPIIEPANYSLSAAESQLSNAQYVEWLYATVLGRGGDTAGSANWVASLSAGISRTTVLQAFVGSGEHRAQLAAGKVALFAPSASGTAIDGGATQGVVSIAGNSSDYLVDATQSQGSIISLAHASISNLANVNTLIFNDNILTIGASGATSMIVNSLSAAESQLSNAQYVEWLYATVLGRGGDTAGSANWVASLSAGISRTTVLQAFVGSGEHRAQLAAGGISPLTNNTDSAILSTAKNLVFDSGTGVVTGTSASETLFASIGSTMTGGGGADHFYADRGLGKVLITDFSGQDTLDLNPFIRAGEAPTISISGSNSIVSFGTSDSITLLGVSPAHLTLSGGSLSFH